MTADAGNVRSDEDARVARWAKAAEDAGTYMMGAMAEATVGVRDADDWVGPASVEAAATFLVPVADEELAGLRAEVEAERDRLREAVEVLREAKGRWCTVCTGRSPQWDGHDKHPMCETAAWDALHAVLADAAPDPTPNTGMERRYPRAGLEHRYDVKRVGDTEGKHDDCRFFVLDPQHDPIARDALATYAAVAANRGYHELSRDLWRWVDEYPLRDPATSSGDPTPNTGEAQPSGWDRCKGCGYGGWYGSRWHNPPYGAHYHCDQCDRPCQPCSVGDGFHRSNPRMPAEHEACDCQPAASSVDDRPGCHADRDGDCSWGGCPQLRDGEPKATGRHCPLDTGDDERFADAAPDPTPNTGERPKRHLHSRRVTEQCIHRGPDCCVDCCEPGGAFETPTASSVDDKAGERSP